MTLTKIQKFANIGYHFYSQYPCSVEDQVIKP